MADLIYKEKPNYEQGHRGIIGSIIYVVSVIVNDKLLDQRVFFSHENASFYAYEESIKYGIRSVYVTANTITE